MTKTPTNLLYSASHQWLALDDDGTARVGITDFAQEALGDVVFVEFPHLGQSIAKDEACAVVESVKSASDVFSPVSGTIVAINSELESAPEKLNQAPYEAWLFKLELKNRSEIDSLLAAADYQKLTIES